MWGTGLKRLLAFLKERFIPTHVGNRTGAGARAALSPVHPHACGEQKCGPGLSGYQCGSSPRMWGTVFAIEAELLEFRFIPTHVGNSSFPQRRPCRRAVHPHACGEQWRPRQRPRVRGGSSHACGEQSDKTVSSSVSLRFIPTHVGNSRPLVARVRQESVHPHACGEQCSAQPH